MKAAAPSSIQQRIGYRYSALTASCFTAAMLQAMATGITIALVSQFQQTFFSLLHLLSFVPSHDLLWRAWCAAQCAGVLGMLFVYVSWSKLIARRFRVPASYAALIMAMGSLAALDAYLMMLTQFGDLSREANYNFSINQTGTLQLATVTMTNFLSKLLLLSNTLECVGGLMLSICSFMSPRFPRLVAWIGLLTWLFAINAMITSATGQVDSALKIYFLSRAFLVLWAATFGAVCTVRAANKIAQPQQDAAPEPGQPSLPGD